MNKLMKIIIAIFIVNSVFAQVPEKINYQAIIRNNTNTLVINQSISIRVSILQGSVTGIAIYSETHTPQTDDNGLINIDIGGGATVLGLFSKINWSDGPFFVKTETDPYGGTNYSITGTSQLLSVPYALYAKSAARISNSVDGIFSHYIGEQFGGGVIFHLWKDNQGNEHGLIVDIIDASTNSSWTSIYQSNTGAYSSWDGLSNSNSITTQVGHINSAAKVCLDLVSNGQSDWYLPSIDELKLIWQNQFSINKTLSLINGASILDPLGQYWSSTENNTYTSFTFRFYSGRIGVDPKTYGRRVRAIRSF